MSPRPTPASRAALARSRADAHIAKAREAELAPVRSVVRFMRKRALECPNDTDATMLEETARAIEQHLAESAQ